MEDIKFTCEIIYYITLSAGVLVGGLFSFFQWNKQIKLKQTEFLNGVMNSLLDDEDIVEVIYTMEYCDDWYKDDEENKFHGSGFEKKIDKTLSHYSYFATLCKRKLIAENDFDFVKYTIERILKNQSTQEYLNFLFDFSIKNSIFFPYTSLIEYGKKRKIIDKNSFLYL